MLTKESLVSFREKLVSYVTSASLPDETDFAGLLNAAITVLETEDSSYRCLGNNGEVGGLLDFSSRSVSVVLVPDIHARPEFMLRILDYTTDSGATVLERLNDGSLIVVCVGDGVHTEALQCDYDRWKQSFVSWSDGKVDCPSMREEMRLGISTMMCIMELKIAFPDGFHFLKGNHENILNADCCGDLSFRKFAMEGQMAKDFVQHYYGDVVLHLWHCFESLLPIVACFDTFCVSHGEPAFACSKQDIINYHDEDIVESIVLNFTWTGNGQAEEGSVAELFESLTGKSGEKALWFGGHRPVQGKYKLRQNGHYVQFHNPLEMNVVYLESGKVFNAEKDIVSVIR